MIVSIHQPNFFPWLGYFDKIIRSDIFIILDHVQFPKKGGTWSNRVKLVDGGAAGWVTAPIDRNYHGLRSYHEIKFKSDIPWRKKIIRTVEVNYHTAPHFSDYFDFISELILNNDDNLSTYNENAVRQIMHILGISDEKLRRSSELHAVGHSNEMLVSLTTAVGGNIYMCGGGADVYQRPEVFEASDVTLKRQDFQHPRYKQTIDNWTPGLSIIDALFNVGTQGVRKLLNTD